MPSPSAAGEELFVAYGQHYNPVVPALYDEAAIER
jgi:hypothetical protein